MKKEKEKETEWYDKDDCKNITEEEKEKQRTIYYEELNNLLSKMRKELCQERKIHNLFLFKQEEKEFHQNDHYNILYSNTCDCEIRIDLNNESDYHYIKEHYFSFFDSFGTIKHDRYNYEFYMVEPMKKYSFMSIYVFFKYSSPWCFDLMDNYIDHIVVNPDEKKKTELNHQTNQMESIINPIHF